MASSSQSPERVLVVEALKKPGGVLRNYFFIVLRNNVFVEFAILFPLRDLEVNEACPKSGALIHVPCRQGVAQNYS